MSDDDRERERRKFVENSDKWGVGMAVVFIVALLLYPLFKALDGSDTPHPQSRVEGLGGQPPVAYGRGRFGRYGRFDAGGCGHMAGARLRRLSELNADAPEYAADTPEIHIDPPRFSFAPWMWIPLGLIACWLLALIVVRWPMRPPETEIRIRAASSPNPTASGSRDARGTGASIARWDCSAAIGAAGV